MRDPNRCFDFLEQVAWLWSKNCPDWRFGQLLSNWILAEGRDPFYWEEDKFLEELRKFCDTYFKDPPQTMDEWKQRAKNK
jgi:hypothetical protein